MCAITRDGKTYLDKDQMAPAELPQKVKDMLANRLDKTVFVSPTRARGMKKSWTWWTICVRRVWINWVC